MNKTLLLAFASTIFLINGCKKKDTDVVKGCMDKTSVTYNPEAEEDDGSCKDYAITSIDQSTKSASETTSQLSEDVMVYNFVSNSSENGLAGKMPVDSLAIPGCASTNYDNGGGPNVWPKTLTIDFGTTGCAGYDGKVRKGKIIAQFTSLWRLHNAGDSVIVSFQNYSVNDTIFSGTRYFWLTGYTTGQSMTVGYKVANGGIAYPNGKSASWSGTGSFSINGLSTPTDYTDDIVSVSVSGTATNIEGNTYTISTTSPLTSVLDCMDKCVFVNGAMNIATTNTSSVNYGSVTVSTNTVTTVTLNFGTGSCDGSLSYTTHIVTTTSAGTTVLDQTTGPVTQSCDGF